MERTQLTPIQFDLLRLRSYVMELEKECRTTGERDNTYRGPLNHILAHLNQASFDLTQLDGKMADDGLPTGANMRKANS